MLRALFVTLTLAAFVPQHANSQSPLPIVRLDRQSGFAYKHGTRLPGKIALGEQTYTREGRPLTILAITAGGTNVISDDRVSSLEGYLHTRTSTTKTTYRYDPAGRVTEITHSSLGVIYRTTFTYDSIAEERSTHLSHATHFDGNRISGYRITLYDKADSIVSVCEFDKNHKLLTADSITYDGAHQRVSETHLSFGDGERLLNGNAKQYQYDDAGRLSGISFEAGGQLNGTERYTYDGASVLPVSLIEGEREWRYKYNATGQLVEEIEIDGGKTDGYRRFEYDNQGSLVRETSYNAKEQMVDEILHEVQYW